jgi:hypothetical protein
VRSDSVAATAYKVAKAYFRTMRIRGSHWLLVHLQTMRIYSANLKGGDITIVKRSPVFGHLLVCTGPSFSQKAPVLPESRHFQVIGSRVPRLFSLSVSPDGYDPRVVGNTNQILDIHV